MIDEREQNGETAIRYGGLTAAPGFLLRLAQLRDYTLLFQNWQAGKLAPGRLTVLRLIDLNPGIRQGELARHLFIKRAHMTKLVRQCQAESWVRIETPADDRRGVSLFLTETGNALVEETATRFDPLAMAPMPNLSSDETQALTSLLRKSLGLPGPGNED